MNEPVSAIVPNSCRPVAYIRGADFYKDAGAPGLVSGRSDRLGGLGLGETRSWLERMESALAVVLTLEKGRMQRRLRSPSRWSIRCNTATVYAYTLN